MKELEANQQEIQEATKELEKEQKRNIEIHEKKKKKKEPKKKSKKRSKKIKKKSKKSSRRYRESSSYERRHHRRYDSGSESSPSLSKVLKKKVSRSNFTQILHKIDDKTMKEMDQVQDINALTNYNNMANATADDPNAQSEFDNIDPFTFVKLDHNASKYWDERSAPLDNVYELNNLNLNAIRDPSNTYLLEIITPCLPTRFYEKMPDRILKNFQFSGRNKNISSLVSAWKKDDLSTMNNDKEFDNRMRKNQMARPEDAAKWYSKTMNGSNKITNETFGEAWSNYAADLEKNIGSRGLPANYRGSPYNNFISFN
jgi:hypothetical protein